MIALFGSASLERPIAAYAQDATPDALFSAARAALANQSYPSHIAYSIVVRVQAAGKTHEDHYRGSIEGSNDNFRVDQFSDEERANPSTPHGINVVWLAGSTGTAIALSKRTPGEPMGIPDLSPIYSFGLRKCPTLEPADTGEDATLKTIGRVVSANHIYNVSSLGPEVIDGTNVTHLSLAPITNPARNRLRDVWIDSSDLIIQARTSGNFRARETEHVPWVIRYKQIDGGNYVVSESSEAPVKFAGHVYDSVTIEFRDIVLNVDSGPSRFARDLRFALPQIRSKGANLIEPSDGDAC